MGDRTCPVETDGKVCGKPSAKDNRNWCSMHRNRWYRHGDVHHLGRFGLEKTASAEERFWAKVDADGDCWIWTGAIGTHGYGVFCETGVRSGQRKTRTAHRYAYEMLVGPIPDDMTLDHLCRNRPCLNPDHLEICPLAENVRRAIKGRKFPNRRPKPIREQCKQGHSMSGENLYVTPRGVRVCRACQSARNRTYYLQRKAA